MKLGFTGTQRGLDSFQWSKVRAYVHGLAPEECHHGDCIGADAEFHGICRGFKFKIIVHPPLKRIKRAFCKGDETLPALPYLERNRAIVDECDELLACPYERREQLRSGTWATIRYARKTGKPVRIIYPDGFIEE
ncbi:MAG: hypothetical protein ACE5HV_00080 [Acidobacteriota bacterium]